MRSRIEGQAIFVNRTEKTLAGDRGRSSAFSFQKRGAKLLNDDFFVACYRQIEKLPTADPKVERR